MSRNLPETATTNNSRKLSFLLVLTVLSMFFISCLDLADNTIHLEIASPGLKYRVVVFNRDAGATTDFSTQISILRTNDRIPGGIGNVFICDSDHGKVTDTYDRGGPRVAVTWKSESLLHIDVPKLARIFKKQNKIGEVEIEYSENE